MVLKINERNMLRTSFPKYVLSLSLSNEEYNLTTRREIDLGNMEQRRTEAAKPRRLNRKASFGGSKL